MAKRYKEPESKIKKAKKTTPSKNNEKQTKEDLIRQKEIQKQKAKRKQKLEQEKKKEEERKKEIKKQKAEKRRTERERATMQKEREKQRVAKEKEKEKIKKQLEKQHRQLEQQKKLEEERKKQERIERVKQRKLQEERKNRENEVNSAKAVTKKNKQKTKKQNHHKQEQTIKQREKELKKEKTKKRTIQIVVLLAIVLGVCAFALISPIFNIKDIEIEENVQVSDDTIISLSGLAKDQNIFRFLKLGVISKIKEDPYIEDAEIKRILPSTVKIKVKERTKKFSVQVLNSYAIISSQGYILEISEESQELPILKGLSTTEDQLEVGKRLNENDLGDLETFIKIMNTFKDNELDEQVSSIELTQENQFIVTMEKEQKIIYLGDKTNLSHKIIYVKSIVEDTKDTPGEIFVNGDINDNFKPYFREKIS